MKKETYLQKYGSIYVVLLIILFAILWIVSTPEKYNPEIHKCTNYNYGCHNGKEEINHLSGRLDCRVDRYTSYQAQEDVCVEWIKKDKSP